MNTPTTLLRTFQRAVTAFKAANTADRDTLRELYRAEKEAFQALNTALGAAVPFEMVKDGQVVGTVRTIGAVTSPGWMLNYSEEPNAQYTFRGKSLLAVDEIRGVGDE